jgi:hypothetical protein
VAHERARREEQSAPCERRRCRLQGQRPNTTGGDQSLQIQKLRYLEAASISLVRLDRQLVA